MKNINIIWGVASLIVSIGSSMFITVTGQPTFFYVLALFPLVVGVKSLLVGLKERQRLVSTDNSYLFGFRKKPFWEKYRLQGPAHEKGFLKLTKRYLDETATIPKDKLLRYDSCAQDYIYPTAIHQLKSEEGVERHRALALAYIDAISKRGFQSRMNKDEINSRHDSLIQGLKWDAMTLEERMEAERFER